RNLGVNAPIAAHQGHVGHQGVAFSFGRRESADAGSRRFVRRALCALVIVLAGSAAWAGQGPISIVAAGDFYADVAAQIGGSAVHVQSILNSPAQDPHLFEVTPSAARAITGARVVIYNGIDYDPWISKLLVAAPTLGQQRIEVASLLGRKS